MKTNHDDEMEEVPVQDSGGRIWVNSFNEAAAASFANKVFSVAEKSPNEPIVCYIDSYGGAIDGLNTMLSVVDSIPNKLITIATGKAMSAGAVLLSHGDVRCVGAHCRVMVHMASGGAGGHVDDVRVDAEELFRLNELMVELLAKNCGKTVKALKKLLADKRDIYMNAEEAVRFGVADQVGIPLLSRTVEVHGIFHQPIPVVAKAPRKKKR